MSKKLDRLWVLGDSHSTPNVCVNPSESFWGLCATELEVNTVINCSRPKISFDSVCHILVGEQASFDFTKDFFLIGVPPLERLTVFDDYRNTVFQAHTFDMPTWQSQQHQILSHHGLVNLQYQELDKVMLLIHDRSWVETQVLRQLFFLTQWLDKCKANYLIVNLSKNLDKHNVWGPSQIILDYCLQHPMCVLFENSLYDVNIDVNRPADYDRYGWFGHHGPAGNRLFFERAIKSKLC